MKRLKVGRGSRWLMRIECYQAIKFEFFGILEKFNKGN